jgi:hypothetical protein
VQSRRLQKNQKEVCMQAIQKHTYKRKPLLTVWPGKVPQWLAFPLFLLAVLLLQRCCSFLVQLLSNYISTGVSLYGGLSHTVSTWSYQLDLPVGPPRIPKEVSTYILAGFWQSISLQPDLVSKNRLIKRCSASRLLCRDITFVLESEAARLIQ